MAFLFCFLTSPPSVIYKKTWLPDPDKLVILRHFLDQPTLWIVIFLALKKKKAIMRYHLISVRMTIIKKSTNNKCWRGCRGKGTLLHCWWEYKLLQPLWRTVWRFLRKLNLELPCDPAIPFLGIYSDKTIIQKDPCTPVLITAPFTIAETS